MISEDKCFYFGVFLVVAQILFQCLVVFRRFGHRRRVNRLLWCLLRESVLFFIRKCEVWVHGLLQ